MCRGLLGVFVVPLLGALLCILTRPVTDQCQAERNLQPNLLAVDFVGEGDVMAVVDALNGVD